MIRLKVLPVPLHRLCRPVAVNNVNFQQRNNSLQSSIESVAKTQHGIFQTLSESKPVELLQNMLLDYHQVSGLPWWFTIISTTFLLRTCITFPLAIYQNYIFAKVQNLQLELSDLARELRKEVAVAVKMYKWDEATAKHHYRYSLNKLWKKLIVENNCHPAKGFLLVWIQIPMWISFSMALRNLVYMLPNADTSAQITFLELSSGGFGFIHNLALPDSSFILPLLLGAVNLAIIEIQDLRRTKERTKLQTVGLNVFRGVSILMVPIAASVPSCLALYWTTSSCVGLVHNLALLSPTIRRVCRIPSTANDLEKPYSHIFSAARKKLRMLPSG